MTNAARQESSFRPVDILSVADAFPEYRLTQRDAFETVKAVFGPQISGLTPEASRLAQAFERAGVETRATCFPKEWYTSKRSWPERMAAFKENAISLLQKAAKEALDQAKLTADKVDAVVTVSTTGITTPSLDAFLIDPLGFRPDITRTPVFGLGCAGGVNGLSRAADLARAQPGSVVLLLVVELCSLTFRPQDMGKANIIGTALFGDGAAAVLLRSESVKKGGGASPAPARHFGSFETTLPKSLDVMGWTIEEDGFGVLFSKDIPTLVSANLPMIFTSFLDQYSLDAKDLGGIIAHPGGAKVLDAYEKALEFKKDALLTSREVLRKYGNTSAVSVLSVLKNTQSDGIHVMMALGPGFTAGFALVELRKAL